MKRLLKKNQIIIATLAVMIAVAGYLNYSGVLFGEEDSAAEANAELAGQELLDISEEDIESSTEDIESLDSEVEGTPGEAVLTSGTAAATVAQAKNHAGTGAGGEQRNASGHHRQRKSQR